MHLRRWVIPSVTAGLLTAVVAMVLSSELGTHRSFAAENATMFVLLGVSFDVVMYFLWQRCRLMFWRLRTDGRIDLVNWMLAGIALADLGWMINRWFWFQYCLLKIRGGPAVEFAAQYQWFSALSLMIVAAGITIKIGPALRHWCGPLWPVWAAAALACIWMTAYQISIG